MKGRRASYTLIVLIFSSIYKEKRWHLFLSAYSVQAVNLILCYFDIEESNTCTGYKTPVRILYLSGRRFISVIEYNWILQFDDTLIQLYDRVKLETYFTLTSKKISFLEFFHREDCSICSYKQRWWSLHSVRLCIKKLVESSPHR